MTDKNQHVIEVELDWDALEVAVERNAPDTDSFLDLTTGHVIAIVAGDPEAALRRQQVSDNIKSFLRVEPASSREQYRWMERFVSSVADDALRERLIISIDGKGAFRRFKDVLLAYPAERERWFSYRAELLHWHIQTWLGEHGITGTRPSPWGEVAAPAELAQVPGKPIVHGLESPGESLRRQARDLIDGIATIDLPSAIAFLTFLKERGGEALISASAASVDSGADPGADDDVGDGELGGDDRGGDGEGLRPGSREGALAAHRVAG